MKLDISIRHFGKINAASLKLRPFTVIAGPNSSGKSFATKALYSFFNAVNKDHLAIEAFDSHNTIKEVLGPVSRVWQKSPKTPRNAA
ncbi:AAA family ATPase [Methylovulum psychrotolerans]|uniref:AAA family ATPase n=1 Tax=Methylovulum psychrotolerans TaxID=1704499 RepID=UPI001BFF00EB|nr:AAA family ATPase [Methylovulum psychrotolerans]MBT9100153.1 AAA family ATPase [Methylovulum psychrotolerans]